MMDTMESVPDFSSTDNSDHETRKFKTDSANQAHLDRPFLGLRTLSGFGLLSFFLMASAAAITVFIFAGRRLWPAVFLLMILFLLAGLGRALYHRRLRSRISWVIDCINRVAKGDFSPISPKGKYRDEFTAIDIALNRMLDDWHAFHIVSMESHQLASIGTLTAGVAHEINNPLNNIMLTAHTLMEEYSELPEKERLEIINELIHETERAQRIVQNLQDFARESECVSEPLDVGELLEETVQSAVNQAKGSTAKINIDIQPHIPSIHGDREQWKQVFLNLISNALEAAEKEGQIDIRAEKGRPSGFLAVHVDDNGCGIPAHVLPYIFDPFFTTKPPGKGTGLGLSVSKGIVTRYGGHIHVSSRQGEQTRFTVLIPATDVAPAECRNKNRS